MTAYENVYTEGTRIEVMWIECIKLYKNQTKNFTHISYFHRVKNGVYIQNMKTKTQNSKAQMSGL